jgi:mevalonate kinase
MNLEPRAATAPGKVILLGEHAVVFGEPALAAALPFGVRATVTPTLSGGLVIDAPGVPMDDVRVQAAVELMASRMGVGHAHIRVDSELPIGGGLGSSAAFSVALLRALSPGPLDETALVGHSLASEALFHGTPSGVDSAVCARGGLIRFQRRGPVEVATVRAARPLSLVVALTGRTRRTSSTVRSLRARVEAEPEQWLPVVARLGALVEGGVDDVVSGDHRALGARMDEAHALLATCGVSTDELDEIVRTARAAGALGAKLTGAGGGGAAVALVEDPAEVSAAILRRGFACHTVTVG